ncbi:hypothetical protein GCM10007860_00170 [Chitiniphilus shinanonensis]|uniref:DUF2782 domain-containing protein n=1 Tax=Chitiniphilus shinanonensis TaxID=553088 RepID=A0ABQ6BST5_9NEIS|nr:DUF2782 domain-containing protein [Chitiniphilus shinanonensis]GLS02874.1 hypothetical protein GCM10007860_00170 [Chitiniphilus shinanonensis]
MPVSPRYLACLFSLLAAFAVAADDTPPPMPDEGADAATVEEPEVRIIEKDDATVAEYRIQGKLYMMRVTPRVGKPYYLIDREGNGRFDREDIGGPNLSVPRWVLFEW